tara:strand:- start:2103 stop:2717 length:615 start_codon:yes stop_codon:yes gene_type:complete
MAANEHKNLSNSNLHDPKDFSIATNDTLLSKDDAGNLIWAEKKLIKTDNVVFMGVSTFSSTNYFLYRDKAHSSSERMQVDYGSITPTTLTPQQALRYGRYVSHDDCNLLRFTGVITNTNPDDCFLALWRVSPVDDSSAALTITVLKEVTVSGKGNLTVRTFDVDMTSELNNTLTRGDIIVPVVRNIDSSSSMFFSSTLSMSYNK